MALAVAPPTRPRVRSSRDCSIDPSRQVGLSRTLPREAQGASSDTFHPPTHAVARSCTIDPSHRLGHSRTPLGTKDVDVGGSHLSVTVVWVSRQGHMGARLLASGRTDGTGVDHRPCMCAPRCPSCALARLTRQGPYVFGARQDTRRRRAAWDVFRDARDVPGRLHPVGGATAYSEAARLFT
jgi:hypothetical protein